jgi:hypothetical protein
MTDRNPFTYQCCIIITLFFMMNAPLNAVEWDDFYGLDNLTSVWDMDQSHPSMEGKHFFSESLQSLKDWPREKKVIALNLTAFSAIAVFGAVSWEYGSSSFNSQSEGWFGQDTKYGGADKLGHAYGAYVLTSIYNSVYKSWGYSEEEAIWGGALSGWSQTTLVEVGDGFSTEHGFSWEDEVMNTLGVGMAFLRHRYPSLKEKIDFRLEWIPSSSFRSGDQGDIFTDYSGQKYLLALKPDGFLKTDNPFLKAMEIHIGYYSRGYDEVDEHRTSNGKRFNYVGIGLNVTYLLEQLTGHDAKHVFDYIQIPYTYLSSSSEIK